MSASRPRRRVGASGSDVAQLIDRRIVIRGAGDLEERVTARA
jgi:hypothetical protein